MRLYIMSKHQNPRCTVRQWKFILRCPADKAAAAQDLIRARYTEFIKLRRVDAPELKADGVIEKSPVVPPAVFAR